MARQRKSHKSGDKADIPEYSRCCNEPVLPRPGMLYCYGCNRAASDLRGPKRLKALAELRWERTWPLCLSLMWRNLRVAYARDVPDYSPDCQRIIAVSYKWVIGCSGADFSRIATALGLMPSLEFGYPGRDNFASFKDAAQDLWKYLDERDKGLIPDYRPALHGKAIHS